MKCEIKLLGITLSPDLLNGVVKIMNENHYNRITSLRLLSNYFGNNKRLLSKKNSKAVHYRPMIVCFCVSLASKSPSAYDEIRDSNILVLPSRRTFRDH